MAKLPKLVRDETDEPDNGLNVLLLAALPLLLWLFQGSSVGVFTAVLALMLLALAMVLIAQGQKYQRTYETATTAMRPGFPRKVCGSILLGMLVLILSGHHFVSLHVPLLMGVIATTLSIGAFGIDPMRDKEGPEDLQDTATSKAKRPADDGVIVAAQAQFADLTNRVDALQDADLARRAKAASEMVLRLARALQSETGSAKSLRKPVAKFAAILDSEVTRLESGWGSEHQDFARRRFVAKLQVLSESFEQHARKRSAKGGRDAFDFEADILLDRMPGETAA